MTARTWSLWLQPDLDGAADLEPVIARLAAVHGSAVFEPHLTLLGPLERDAPAAVAGLDRVAESLSPLLIRFDEVRCEPVWQRSVYLAAALNPVLWQAGEVAAAAFSVSAQPEFMPHLSLQYSELPLAQKRRLAASLELRLPLCLRFDRLSLWRTEGSDARRWRLRAIRALDG